MPRPFKIFLHFLFPFSIILLGWEAAAWGTHYFRGVSFPGPVDTLVRFWAVLLGDFLSGASIYHHALDSLYRWLMGFSIAAAAGIGFGLASARFSWFHKALYPIPQICLLIPGLAWVPVAILLFGIGETATVFMIAVSGFAPIAVNTLSGIRQMDIRLIRAAQMLGADKNTLFFKVLLPGALPAVLTGLRVGLGTGWRVLVAAEMVVGTGTGLGYAIIQSRWTLDYASSFVCIGLICIIGLCLERGILRQMERRTIQKWTLVQEK